MEAHSDGQYLTPVDGNVSTMYGYDAMGLEGSVCASQVSDELHLVICQHLSTDVLVPRQNISCGMEDAAAT